MANGRRVGRKSLWVGVLSLFVIGTCSPSAPPKIVGSKGTQINDAVCKEPPSLSAFEENASRDLRLSLSTYQAKPGEVLTMVVESPPSVAGGRGIESYLECWNGTTWVRQYVLWTGSKNNTPGWAPIDQDPILPLIGYDMKVPESIKVPEEAPVGSYRIAKSVTIKPGGASNTVILHAALRVY